jgi:hypothetical protein
MNKSQSGIYLATTNKAYKKVKQMEKKYCPKKSTLKNEIVYFSHV